MWVTSFLVYSGQNYQQSQIMQLVLRWQGKIYKRLKKIKKWIKEKFNMCLLQAWACRHNRPVSHGPELCLCEAVWAGVGTKAQTRKARANTRVLHLLLSIYMGVQRGSNTKISRFSFFSYLFITDQCETTCSVCHQWGSNAWDYE